MAGFDHRDVDGGVFVSKVVLAYLRVSSRPVSKGSREKGAAEIYTSGQSVISHPYLAVAVYSSLVCIKPKDLKGRSWSG
jgi:hypothetical protein